MHACAKIKVRKTVSKSIQRDSTHSEKKTITPSYWKVNGGKRNIAILNLLVIIDRWKIAAPLGLRDAISEFIFYYYCGSEAEWDLGSPIIWPGTIKSLSGPI